MVYTKGIYLSKQKPNEMTRQEMHQAFLSGQKELIYTDSDGKQYNHTIVKAGPKQVSIYNNFLKREYKVNASWDFPQYRIKSNQ